MKEIVFGTQGNSAMHHISISYRSYWLVISFFLLLFSTSAVAAQTQPQDEDFAAMVKQWTTLPEFVSPLVDHLPKVTGIPSPKDILGYHIGAPKKLTYYQDILRYYRTLAEKSGRVKVLKIGMTDEGRECVVVFVGTEETIAKFEQYRQALGRLADPRLLSESQAREVIAGAKPLYHLMGGLHSSETGASEMLMELAYRLVTENTTIIDQIRRNIIVSITPVADPDGRDRYVDWYYRYRVDQTDERNAVAGPPYWGKYVYHDNNRDINYSQLYTRALLDWYLQWHPPIMHDLHESVPFLFTFSGQAPQNPSLDPILFGELPWFSNFEMSQMIKYGMPGVWTHAFADVWSPGYLGFMSSNHNGILRMYETFGNGGATTMKRRIESPEREGAPGGGRGSQTTREWYRPLPAYKEVEWSMRNNTNYMETGVLSALQLTSGFPSVILENFYKKSRNAVESGKNEAPFGYIIPAGQRDTTRVAWVVNLLRIQGIEVGRADAEVKLKEGVFPAGSYLIKRNQPYGRLAKILLEKQDLPDPNLRSYDDTGWTLGLMTHTEIKETADKAILDVPVEPVSEVQLKGSIIGPAAPAAYLVAHNGSNQMITLRCRLKDLKARVIEKPFKVGESEFPAGSLLIPVDAAAGDQRPRIGDVITRLGLTAAALSSLPAVAMHDAELPRMAIYSTWGSTQEVGWVRLAFDRFEIPYDLIYKERVRQGNLRSSYDAIVIPSQGRSAKGLVYDIAPREKPIAYNRTEQYKNLGLYGESEDITGGMGLEGTLELQKFAEQGGVLLTLGSASFFPAEFGIAREVDATRPSTQFYAPGPIVEAEILKPLHPIFYGYAQTTLPVRYAGGPLLQVPERDRGKQVLMRFPGTEKSVLSGLARGVGEIRNRAAIVDVPVGKGHVILFATNPCYRWQNHGEFNMLFNALLNFNDLNAAASGQQ